MQVTMKDRVAVVTGGSKGLGLAMARQFAASGAKVAMLARGAQDLKAARELLARDGIDGPRLCLRRLEGLRHRQGA